jgi:hypothetical protein
LRLPGRRASPELVGKVVPRSNPGHVDTRTIEAPGFLQSAPDTRAVARVVARDEHDPARGGWGGCHAPSVGDSPAAMQDRRLMEAPFVDLPAHLCPNWGPATFDGELATTYGRR